MTCKAIATLGFRGEALPSIASVSRLTLTTREREAVAGTQVGSAGGAEPRASAIGCAPGTAVEVRDLFFNVPARLKFLKSRPTESGHVAAVCTRLALVQPEIALSLHERRPCRARLRARRRASSSGSSRSSRAKRSRRSRMSATAFWSSARYRRRSAGETDRRGCICS